MQIDRPWSVMLPLLRLVLGVSSLMGIVAADLRSQAGITEYVTEYQTETRVEREVRRRITDDFEAVLSESSSSGYTVLERRRIGTLAAEVKSEADLTRNPELVERFRRNGAQAIFLGQVEEDSADGSFVFYVSLVDLNG